jgi:hypothetical protein
MSLKRVLQIYPVLMLLCLSRQQYQHLFRVNPLRQCSGEQFGFEWLLLPVVSGFLIIASSQKSENLFAAHFVSS